MRTKTDRGRLPTFVAAATLLQSGRECSLFYYRVPGGARAVVEDINGHVWAAPGGQQHFQAMFYHLRLDPSEVSRFNCAEIDNNVGYRCETSLQVELRLEPSFLFLFFFCRAHPQPEWMLMDARAITSEPRDLTPSSWYGYNLLHLRSAFGLTPSKHLYRKRNKRVPRLVFFFNKTIDINHEKLMFSMTETLDGMHRFQHTFYCTVFSFNHQLLTSLSMLFTHNLCVDTADFS